MSSILELREARERAMHWSVDNYVQFGEMLSEHGVLPKRAELIRGIIIEKMPKSPLHVRLTKWLYDLLFEQAPDGCLVFQEGPLQLHTSVSEPDVMIVPGGKTEFDDKHPTKALLVVEVAVSSVTLEREYASMYAEAGVPEYWIVLAEDKLVEVRRRPVNGVYQDVRSYHRQEELHCESVAAVNVPLTRLFLP